MTAIVGASGSGKTTLIKLMLGYYPVNCGSIDIAGADINRYSMTWWRRRCGVVMQEGVIFSESIARNIAVSDGDIDEARLEEAARTACIHDYIMSLPLRYNTKIGRDGVGLSQDRNSAYSLPVPCTATPTTYFSTRPPTRSTLATSGKS